jgi:nicotinate phosphoribosyltransferase
VNADPARGNWVTDNDIALLTDQYELAMLQAYWREGMQEDAVFSLFVRRLPEKRNFLLACGLDDALGYLESLRFTADALEYLHGRPELEAGFVDWLSTLRFTGDVYAVREGTPVFGQEPLLEVHAPLPQAQLVETVLMNQVHLGTLLASKAARVVLAADGRPVVDFGLRRMHGVDAGLKAARAFHIAGVSATSNVLAGKVYGVPVAGTMAHSYVQACDSELDAFRAFARLYPGTTLLVDTYDTLRGVRNVVRLAEEMGASFRVSAIRLDSGDLGALAVEARKILDHGGLSNVHIFASGGLDESDVARLVRTGAPIDAFGVGTSMGVSGDAPSLDIAYKLVEYAGHPRLKLSSGKRLLPGAKQVFRVYREGAAVHDTLARSGEELPGRPLLQRVMQGGRRLPAASTSLQEAREYAAREIAALPERLRQLEAASPPYPVEVSRALRALEREVEESIERDAEVRS